MKLAPTVLVLAAFGVLLWVSSSNPANGGMGAGHGAQEAATEIVKPLASPADLPAPARDPNRLIVTVRDPAGHGQPQIQVVLQNASGKAVAKKATDAAGRAVFDAVAAGSLTVVASDPDWLYTSRGSVKVDAKKDATTDVDLRVERGGGGLRGWVVDGAGKPVAERRVLLGAGGTDFSVQTDAKGRFLVNGLVAGDWTVTPDGFPDQKRTVRLADGATEELKLVLARTASVDVELSGSHLHPAHFHGGEVALVRPAGNTQVAPLSRKMTLHEEGGRGHHQVARADFGGVQPGVYEVEILDAKGESLLQPGKPWSAPIPLTLVEGDVRTLPLKTGASARGGGVEVPTGWVVFMFLAIAAMVFVTPVLFPAPLVAKRPLGLQR